MSLLEGHYPGASPRPLRVGEGARRRLVGSSLDVGGEPGEVCEGCLRQFRDESVLGAHPGSVDGADLLPLARPTAQHAFVEEDLSFGGLDDIEERAGLWRACQGLATVRSGHSV